MLTKELVAKALPSHLKNSVNQQLVDTLNNISSDPIAAEHIRENFISYTSVLKEGKFKTEDYLNAVTFVSYRLMGHSNQDAYFKTFPQRYQNLVGRGTSAKDIASYVSAYSRGKLVNAVLEQSLVPSWVLNQELYQRAINVQADLMLTAKSEKVRSDAANSLLTHLAKPKEAGPLVNIDLRESSGMDELKATLTALAQQQRDLIGSGVATKSIAEQQIIELED